MVTIALSSLPKKFATICKEMQKGHSIELTKNGKRYAVIVRDPPVVVRRKRSGRMTIPPDFDKPMHLLFES